MAMEVVAEEGSARRFSHRHSSSCTFASAEVFPGARNRGDVAFSTLSRRIATDRARSVLGSSVGLIAPFKQLALTPGISCQQTTRPAPGTSPSASQGCG